MIHRLGDEAALRQHLDEVPVRVLEKREALDAARVGRLGELAPELREPRTRVVHIGHGDAEVAKASTHRLAVLRAGGVPVADVVHRPCLALGAVVPCQLDAARRAHAEAGKALLRIGRDAGWVDGGHKVDVESPLLELAVRDEVEAEHIAVEGERGRRILDPQHRLLHDKVAGLRLTLLCIVAVHVWRSARDGAGAKVPH
mmetsp:Transcript_2447/g.7915  ORF Transcript_2447/g.7915 Transcript_2447/m.7915 type:complete len:200 (-) Transcript_2447:1938-2537(-)